MTEQLPPIHHLGEVIRDLEHATGLRWEYCPRTPSQVMALDRPRQRFYTVEAERGGGYTAMVCLSLLAHRSPLSDCIEAINEHQAKHPKNKRKR